MFGFGKKNEGAVAPHAQADAAGGSSGAEPVLGLMQTTPMNIADILAHGAKYHAGTEIVSAMVEGEIARHTYAEVYARTKRLANALKRLGVKGGDRVATLAWNTHRHIEAWYAISGMGAICHTINPRLFPEQVAYIMNHANDSVVMVDVNIVPLIDALKDHLPNVGKFIVMTDRAHMPEGDHWLCYEDLIASESEEFVWPRFDENTASSLCYTSGTTGDPKGVLYSHRSNLIMSYAILSRDVMNMGLGDCGLMVVPMFHANAWGMAYGAIMVGAKLVLPGVALDGPSVHRLIKEEQVTTSAAVPTVWSGLLKHLKDTGADLSPLREVLIGGSAVPRSMIEIFARDYNVDVIHGWGMTEMSPLGSVNRLLPKHENLSFEEKLDVRVKQGRPCFGVEMKIVDDNGVELPWDGESAGRLLVKGPWIVDKYYGRDEEILDADGFFDTGDIAMIDADGIMQITDRAKDVIKSGGEWISSVDLENAAVAHPDVLLACAIGVRHPKWEERPLLLVTMREGATPDLAAINEVLAQKFAKWQLPDDIIVVDELPLTATGKLDKKVLREKYGDHLMSKAAAE